MKRAVKTEKTTNNGRQSVASRASSVSKNVRTNGSKSLACGAFKSSSDSQLTSRKQTPAELRKEIGRLSMEFINCEE